MTENMSNPFGDVMKAIDNPITQLGINHAKSYMNFDKFQYSGLLGKIFSPQIKAYFDIDTQTVLHKVIKLLFPFKNYQWDQQIKKLDLYIPTVSFMTLILFSTIIEGIQQQNFDPKIGRKITWIIIFSVIQILLARCTQNFISHLNIGFIELTALVSYRFVPIAIVTLQLVLTNLSIPYLSLIGVIYVLLVDTYFCKLELSNYARQRFVEEGLGIKIGLGFHFINTLGILWLCNLL